jgi:hypothetical protein
VVRVAAACSVTRQLEPAAGTLRAAVLEWCVHVTPLFQLRMFYRTIDRTTKVEESGRGLF